MLIFITMADSRFGIEDILSFPLFNGLQNQVPALEALMSVMKFETFQIRNFIIKEQSSDDRIFLLLSGDVEINKVKPNGKVVVLGRANSNAHPFFGESALLGQPGRISNVVAHSPCTCLSLRSKDFETFNARFPTVGVQIYRNMAIMMFDRLAKADTDLMILGAN
jgi:CRP-like cAMP-binding protein